MNRHFVTAGLVAGLQAGFGAAPMPAQAETLIRADSAVAGSTFNSLYDIGNTIDGSGLPAAFALADLHGTYVVDNHWTTHWGAIGAGTAWAEFFFDTPQTLGQFHLWNHRSNNIASNAHYAVTQFDLELRDINGDVLLVLEDVQANGQLGTAYSGQVQSFGFAATPGVSSVWFRIDRNLYLDEFGSGGGYTGLAEVAFGAPVPEPGSVALMLLGLTAIGTQLRRRAAGPAGR